MTDAAQEKARLRREALARRDALADAERELRSAEIAARLLALLKKWSPRLVAAYAPIGSEVDLFPLMADKNLGNRATALPVQSGDGLMFLSWRFGDPLVTGRFGVREPAADASVIIPDVLILPLVAFDRHGNRLGYGKGHYDRAIAALADAGNAPRLVGAAFAVQEVEAIPIEPHDALLNMVVTEGETIAFAAD